MTRYCPKGWFCPCCGSTLDDDGYCYACGEDAIESYWNDPSRRQAMVEAFDEEEE